MPQPILMRLSLAVHHSRKSRKRQGETVSHIPATTNPYANVCMTSTQCVSPRAGRPVATSHLAKSNNPTANPRTARKSCTKTQLPMPTPANAAKSHCLYEAKSEMDSWLRFHRNQAVPSSIRAKPQGRERGNLRTAAPKAAGFTRPYICGKPRPRPSKTARVESFKVMSVIEGRAWRIGPGDASWDLRPRRTWAQLPVRFADYALDSKVKKQ